MFLLDCNEIGDFQRFVVVSIDAHSDSSTQSATENREEYEVHGENLLVTIYDENGTAHSKLVSPEQGSFTIHAACGCALILLGTWWCINVYNSWYRSRIDDEQYKSRTTYSCFCGSDRIRNIPWEGCAKLFLSFILFIMQMIRGPPLTLLLVSYPTYLHFTLYFSIALTGLVDILVYCKVDILSSMDNIALSLMFFVETVLFTFHQNALDKVGEMGHKFLTYVSGSTVIIILAEIKYPNSFLLSLARAYSTILQGTWLWVIAYNLIDIDKVNDDPMNAPFMVVYFIWHIVVDMIVTLIIGGIVKIVFVRVYGPIGKYHEYDSVPLIGN